MGSCLSKKGDNPTAVAALNSASLPAKEVKTVVEVKSPAPAKTVVKTEQRKAEDEDIVKKEISVTKHRKSHDKQIQQEQKQQIQIQKLPQQTQSRADDMAIGTPVRTSSCTREEVDAILIQCGRLSRSSSANTPSGKKYSGSKRSFDFDNDGIVSKDEGDERRQSRSRSSPSKPGRRRTPSRDRDSSQQRSGSRERSVVAGSGRRVSRSPGRRSEAPSVSGVESNNGGSRPGKMVSVPASLTSSLVAGNHEQNTVKKIAVKRDARSPRSQSPAQIRQPQPQTLSRSNSRKTDQSPYRRNPLSEIDNNHSSQQTLRKASPNQRAAGAAKVETKVAVQPKAGKTSDTLQSKASQASDSLQPRLNRSKSKSRSRDFDELGRVQDPNPTSYASILLEDIQTFHKKSSNSNVAFSLPQCVTKACSIVEAVADLNSTTSSSFMSNDDNKLCERRKFVARDPFVETELSVNDDLMEPSLHKYVTMGRDGDMGDEESSGSNSVANGGQQQWDSLLETNSVDSTGGLTSKASKLKPFESSRIPVRS
ncbi:unnamed protein product [Rhodiola kirilowii]